MINPVIVTRHPDLAEIFHERGMATPDMPVITHAVAADVRGRDVIGVLPIHVAAEARSVTEVPLVVPAELRGTELTLDQVRRFAGAPRRYLVFRLDVFRLDVF